MGRTVPGLIARIFLPPSRPGAMTFLPGTGFVCETCRSKRTFTRLAASNAEYRNTNKKGSTQKGLCGPSPLPSWTSPPKTELKTPQRTTDFNFWKRLLDRRRRINGDEGVRSVWGTMKRYGVTPPAEEEGMWSVFCEVAANDQTMLSQILRAAAPWDGVYDAMMAKVYPARVYYLHRALYPRFSSRNWGALVASRPDIGFQLRGIVPPMGRESYEKILESVDGEEALAWHRTLLRNGDIPESSVAAQKVVEHLASKAPWTEFRYWIKAMAKKGIRMEESAAVGILCYRPSQKEALEVIFEDTTFKSESAFQDEFWAQMFETQLPPVEVFRYMLFFGEGCVVADKTVNCVMFKLRKSADESVAMLSLAGLDVRASQFVYTPAVKIAPPLLDSLNRALEHHINLREYTEALRTLSAIRKTSSPLDTQILKKLSYILLRPRGTGMKPSIGRNHIFPPGEDIDVVTTLHLRLKAEGYQIDTWTWLEVIKRLGKLERLGDLERLLLRLAPLYNPQGVPIRGPGNPFAGILEPVTMRAMVEWGFIYNRGVWGITLLRKLKEVGVWVDTKTVKRAVRLSLRGQPDQVVQRWRKEAEVAWGEEMWSDDDKVDKVWKREDVT